MPSDMADHTSIIVRLARHTDAGSIAVLTTHLGYPTTPEQAVGRLNRVLQSVEDAVYVAVAPDGAVVGWVHAALRELVMSGPFAQLEGLVVDVAWQGHGIGGRLVAAAEAWALARGCRAIRVRSNVVRTAAHRFNEGLGYQIVKQQVAYRKDLERP